ncbi:MAG TPA: metallophosphatase [Armatimonadota bacterium]|nr:metallophosphatase [Armatimonadota bacterium]
MHRLTLLYTNDMHNRLTPEATDQIQRLKAQEKNVLLLDAGDAVRAGNLGVTPWGESCLEMMGRAGYDVMTAGNRETHLWRWAVRAKTRQADFPVLCANVSGPGVVAGMGEAVVPEALRAYAADGVLYRRYVVVRLPNGLRVAILGLTVPMVTATMSTHRLSQYLFQDPIETAQALVPVLARQADMVLALTHLGLEADRELARRVPGIQMIVGGHSHELLQEPEVVNGTVILQAGCYAKYIGRAETVVENRRATVRASLLPLPKSAKDSR